jgi:hypothetical protein
MNTFHRFRLLSGMIGLFALCGCGGSSNPTPIPTATPPPTPAPTPTPFATLCGSPSPPPFAGMKVKVHVVTNSLRWQLDSRPLVANIDGYCGKVGFDPGARNCETRPEGHPQREACDGLIVGKADTGRVGPTWEDPNGKPCLSPGDTGTQVACINTENQFLVVARGAGQYLACASNEWPLAEPSSALPEGGSRCGGCLMQPNGTLCQ